MRESLKEYLVVILHLFDAESDMKSAEREKGGDDMQQSSSAGGVISTHVRLSPWGTFLLSLIFVMVIQ